MKRLIKKFLNFVLFFPIITFLKFFKNKSEYVLSNMLQITEKKLNRYYTVRSYPKDFSVVAKNYYEKIDRCCIIMQGQYIKEDNFTLNTIKYYISVCNYDVIFSTWVSLDPKIKLELEELGAIVVLSVYPVTAGVLNLNYQVVSTMAGLMEAKKCGYKYVLKTRSDQRLYKQNFLQYFCSLLTQFGKERLVTLNYNLNNICWPNYISDFLYFGEIDRVIKAFTFDKNDKCILYNLPREEHYKKVKEYSREQLTINQMVPECNIIMNYYKNMNIPYDETVKSHLENVKRYFVVVGQDDVGFYWKKYNETYNANRRDGLFVENDKEELSLSLNFTFDNWLVNYSDKIIYNEHLENYKNLNWKFFYK